MSSLMAKQPNRRQKLKRSANVASAGNSGSAAPDLVLSLRESLLHLAEQLQVHREGPPIVEPGQPVTVSISPAPAELGIDVILNLVVPLLGGLDATLSGIIGGSNDQSSLTDVALHLAAEFAPGNVTGSLGSFGSTQSPGNITGALVSQDNVALQSSAVTGTITGALNKLTAQFSTQLLPASDGVNLEMPLTVRLPVSLDVSWTVHSGPATIAAPKNPRQSRIASPELPAGANAILPRLDLPDVSELPLEPPLTEADFVALEGLTGPVASFAFLPAVTELTSNVRPLVTSHRIRAQVTLSVDPQLVPALANLIGNDAIKVGPIALPDVNVLTPALTVPRVLALFRAPLIDLDGFGLVFVPANSPLRTPQQLNGLLAELDAILNKVARLPAAPQTSTATKLLHLARLHSAVQQLRGALAEPRARLIVADRFDKSDTDNPRIDLDPGREGLDGIHMVSRAFAGIDALAKDIRGNQFRSVLFLGAEGRRVRFWVDANPTRSNRQKGELLMTVGPEFSVAIPSFSGPSPASVPAGLVSRIEPPQGNTFEEKISAFRFEL